MDEQTYWAYCVADGNFFDTPARMSDADNRFALADRAAPSGWERGEHDLWVGFKPPIAELPIQGWKIHVSVTMAEAERCLGVVWDYCVAHELNFKFLRSRDAMVLGNAKYAARGTSGKLATLYPRDEAGFEHALTELSQALAGMAGPYVLGDLRIGAGPLYVRYGAFAEMWCQGDGDAPALALENPQGNLVPDRRGPVFTAPDWVRIPEILRPHLEALRSGDGTSFPYRVHEAIHFSNGGGVYLALDPSGAQVVLREARPHAGLDRHGTDAVARLGRERATLERLAGLDCVPRLLGYHVVHGHHFLAEEYVEGLSLLRSVQTRLPAANPEPTPEQIAEYRDWATDVIDKVVVALEAVHARGIRFGDLHPSNVLLRPDGRVVLIDFEFSAELSDETPPGLGAAGFAGPANLTGAALLAPRMRAHDHPRAAPVLTSWISAAMVTLLAVITVPLAMGGLLAVAFLVAAVTNVAFHTEQLRLTPDHLIGRVEAASILIALAAQPLGLLAGGLLVDRFGARIAFLVLGMVIVVSATILTLSLRRT